MFVACSTRCFGKKTLQQAMQTMTELGFTKMELALHEQGPHLRPADIEKDVTHVVQLLKQSPGLAPIAYDVHTDVTDDEACASQLQAICRLARLTCAPQVTIAASPLGASLETESSRLARWVTLAAREGVILSLATRLGTLTEDPNVAVDLCKRVPGLTLTLDPSHYMVGPHQSKGYDHLFPYVRHLHLRDTGRTAQQFQVRVGQGAIEYGRILGQLARYRYDRTLTVDIQDIPDSPFPVEPETRKLKYLLESLV